MIPVLVLNAGSSSLKYQLLDMTDRAVVASGLLERIGEGEVPDHGAALERVLADLARRGALTEPPVAVGHRVVHGGDRFSGPTVVDDAVLAEIRALVPLAPLHNPANIAGIEVARSRFPDVPQVAVFDTAFHATMPPAAWRYALPRELADRLGIRRYGFHGTSHAYVARRAAAHLGRAAAELALVTLHLGNGCSAAAVAGGRSVDTSMGLTPLGGLVMGTRSGDLDPGVVAHLHRQGGLDLDAIDTLLNKASGLKGLAGSNDLREVHAKAAAGGPGAADAAEALDVFCYRIRCTVGAYAAALGRLDAVVFTAGVGENDADVRARVCAGLTAFGLRMDEARNVARSREVRTISADDSAVAVLVIPTNEELEIAEQALAVVRGGRRTLAGVNVVGWLDRLQRRRRWAGLPLAVVYKMVDDQATYLVAIITYYGFVSLFPLLLLLVTALGFALSGNPALQVGVAVQNAMNKIYAVPRAARPALPSLYGRSVALLGILLLSVIATTALSALSTAAGSYGSAPVDAALRAGAVVVSMAVNAAFVLFAYRVLTVETPPVPQLWPGALAASVLWQVLQAVGTYLVEHQLRGATATYGLFGIVLGLLTWLYLAALILVLGAEINVVRARRLYPRSLLAPDPTDTELTAADRRAYSSYARTERAKDHQTVETEFKDVP